MTCTIYILTPGIIIHKSFIELKRRVEVLLNEKCKVVKAPPVQMQKGIMPKLLNSYYYIWCECGYTETWINSKEELNYLK